jgi:zinc protease
LKAFSKGRSNRPRISPAAWVAGLLFTAVLWLAQPAQAELFVADTFTLENGLQVVVLPKHLAPVVYQILVYKAGAAGGGAPPPPRRPIH